MEFEQAPKSTTKTPYTTNYSAPLHDVSFRGILQWQINHLAYLGTGLGARRRRGPETQIRDLFLDF